MQTNRQPADRLNIAFGLILLIAGGVTLIAQLVHFELPEDAWPYVIIVPGVVLLVVGLVVGREAGTGLTVAGSIVTTVGAILLYQNTTEHWESWAYVWALVAPTAPGVGLILSGLVGHQPRMVRDGINMAMVGLVLFVLGLVFFEGIIGITGEEPQLLKNGLLPALLVIVGLILVARSLFFTRPHAGEDTPEDSGTTGATAA